MNNTLKKIIPLCTILTLILSANQLKAQETVTISDSLSGWNYSWIAGLNGSQAAYSNWSQGGVNSLSVNAHSAITGMYRDGRFAYGVLLTTRYGISKIRDQDIRKTDDLLLLINRFVYDLSKNDSDFSLFGEVEFQTQFDKGFNYDAGPNGENVLISRFMAPAYISESAGIAYIPSETYYFEAGLAMKQTIITDDTLIDNYGLDEGSNFRNEAGITLGAGYKHTLVKNFLISSSIETFTNVNKPISSTDVSFSTKFVGKINSFMNVSVRFDMVYDDDFSEEVQIREVLALGVSFVLL